MSIFFADNFISCALNPLQERDGECPAVKPCRLNHPCLYFALHGIINKKEAEMNINDVFAHVDELFESKQTEKV